MNLVKVEKWKNDSDLTMKMKREGGRGMDNLNPLFEQSIIKPSPKLSKKTISNTKTKRSVRSDKGHSVKFPVSLQQQIEFKSSLWRFKYYFPDVRIQQTKYNTLLLWYALDHLHIVDWDLEYIGNSKHHMTTKLPEYRFSEIGGLHGLSIEKGLSDRKTVYKMTISALQYIEKGGYYNEILQQITAFKK
jgi:hypothetical protein